MYGQHVQRSMDQTGMLANPARGQLNREIYFFLSSFVPEILFSLDVPVVSSRVSPLILHTQTESSIWCLITGLLPLSATASIIPSTAIGSIPSLSRHADAYRWCSLSRGRRHKFSSPQGSSSNGCCLFRQVLTWTKFCVPLFSHAYYWYVVDTCGM